jgi:hypothetical protein
MDAPPPFFIGCMARSGSTLLRMMLDGHPQIYVGPESRWHDKRGYRRFLKREYKASPKPYWGDKSPMTIYRENLERLVKVFGDEFRLISIHRHPGDVYASWDQSGKLKTEAKFSERYDRVMDGTSFAREQLADQLLEVGYEELVEDPETVLRSVTDFISCEFDPRMLEWHEQEHDLLPRASYSERKASKGLFASSVSRYRELLRDRPDVKRMLQPYCDFWHYTWADDGDVGGSFEAGPEQRG